MNNIMLKTLNGERTSRPPMWFMRQAGRVLPSYLKLREKYNFHEMMRNRELATEVTLLPHHDLGVDALILFNDILVIPEALGMKLNFTDRGPVFETAIDSVETLDFQPEKLDHVYEAIDGVIEAKPTDLPLFGFCGAPLTVFCYMVEGHSQRANFPKAMSLFYKDPKRAHAILEKITQASILYAVNQAKHGITAFQLFESHAGLLPLALYNKTIMPYVKRILDAVKTTGCKTIFFPKGFGIGVSTIPEGLADYISADWQFELAEMRDALPSSMGIQGNLDPRVLLGSRQSIEIELEKLIPFGAKNQDWIFNLGHGLIPQIPVDNLKFLIDWVKNTNWQRG